jgi:hypothetical protein
LQYHKEHEFKSHPSAIGDIWNMQPINSHESDRPIWRDKFAPGGINDYMSNDGVFDCTLQEILRSINEEPRRMDCSDNSHSQAYDYQSPARANQYASEVIQSNDSNSRNNESHNIDNDQFDFGSENGVQIPVPYAVVLHGEDGQDVSKHEDYYEEQNWFSKQQAQEGFKNYRDNDNSVVDRHDICINHSYGPRKLPSEHYLPAIHSLDDYDLVLQAEEENHKVRSAFQLGPDAFPQTASEQVVLAKQIYFAMVDTTAVVDMSTAKGNIPTGVSRIQNNFYNESELERTSWKVLVSSSDTSAIGMVY